MTGHVKRQLLALIGDDGTGPLWRRLTPDGRQVLELAFVEAREHGHPCIADEHLLLGLLRHGTSPAAAVLRDHGLTLATARTDLAAVRPTLPARSDPATALRTLGIDVDQIRERLEATFGSTAVRAAERRVRRRSWWRGGHSRPSPLCVYLLAKRALHLAVDLADQRGEVEIGPEHLLYGALRDAQDPLGTHLSHRSARRLTPLGWTSGRPNPLRLILQIHGLDPTELADDLAHATTHPA